MRSVLLLSVLYLLLTYTAANAQSKEDDTTATTFGASWQESKTLGYADRRFSNKTNYVLGFSGTYGGAALALDVSLISGHDFRLMAGFRYYISKPQYVTYTQTDYPYPRMDVYTNTIILDLNAELQVGVVRTDEFIFFASAGAVLAPVISDQDAYSSSKEDALYTYSIGVGTEWCNWRTASLGFSVRYSPLRDFTPLIVSLNVCFAAFSK